LLIFYNRYDKFTTLMNSSLAHHDRGRYNRN
jgi:hypothetical protein